MEGKEGSLGLSEQGREQDAGEANSSFILHPSSLNSVSLYIHIPFCQVRCHYCDFTTFVGLEDQRDGYIDALLRELATYPSREFSVSTVFLGGGTPSLLTGKQMERLLSGIRQGITLLPEAEITAECNPGTVDEGKLTAYRDAGINRLSFGAQTFDSQLLQTLGRLHTVGETVEAVGAARSAGFDNINLDLMYGLPRQTLACWEATLVAALALAPQHLSAYGMTIESGTRFWQWQRAGQLGPLPDEDLEVAMLEGARTCLTSAGYRHYEIANFALPGYEARHNLTYWRNHPYIGLGVGSHSWFRRRRYANPVALNAYLNSPVDHRAAPEQSLVEEIEETAFLNLRLLEEGLSLSAFRQRFGRDFLDLYRKVILELIGAGMLAIEGERVHLTPQAVPVANEVFERFLEPELGDIPGVTPTLTLPHKGGGHLGSA